MTDIGKVNKYMDEHLLKFVIVSTEVKIILDLTSKTIARFFENISINIGRDK